MWNKDYQDILQSLLKHKAKFIVVGAYAMGAQGYPRATADFDVWVEPSLENSSRVYTALAEFGAPLKGIDPDTFAEKGIFFQIGVAPRRIDILTHISGVVFDAAYERKTIVKIEKMRIPFLSKKDLIKNKEATGRDKDKLDVKYLKKQLKTK